METDGQTAGWPPGLKRRGNICYLHEIQHSCNVVIILPRWPPSEMMQGILLCGIEQSHETSIRCFASGQNINKAHRMRSTRKRKVPFSIHGTQLQISRFHVGRGVTAGLGLHIAVCTRFPEWHDYGFDEVFERQ